MKTPILTIERSLEKESFGCRPDEYKTVEHKGLFDWSDLANKTKKELLKKGYSIAQAVRFSCSKLKVIYSDGTSEFLDKPSVQ